MSEDPLRAVEICLGCGKPTNQDCGCPAGTGWVGQPIMCEHANEVPAICPCPSTCYCRQHTCIQNYVHGKLCARPDGRCVSHDYCRRLQTCNAVFERERQEKLSKIQPPPIKNDGPPIQDLVIGDVYTRKAIGLERYGTYLQAHNGRDMLRDAYEEALDLCIYLRGALYERDNA